MGGYPWARIGFKPPETPNNISYYHCIWLWCMNRECMELADTTGVVKLNCKCSRSLKAKLQRVKGLMVSTILELPRYQVFIGICHILIN